MSGTLFGLGLSQQHDSNGVPMSGCLLFLYQANTSTAVISYDNPGLTAGGEQPWPLEADSSGRIPAFWLDDGAYRARLTDSDGVVQFDEGNILAVGAGGDVTTDVTPDEAILTTGDVLWRPVNDTKDGWVRLNGRTIGPVTSGASERAQADTQSLFEYLWANFSNTLCPVLPSRGASAAADWADGTKSITLLDMRNKAPFGLDDMGASAAGGFSGVTFAAGDATTGGSKGGAAMHTLTEAELAVHDHPITDPDHTHPLSWNTSGVVGGSSFDAMVSIPGSDGSSDTGPHETNVSVQNAGSGTAHNNMSPFMLGSWYMRL